MLSPQRTAAVASRGAGEVSNFPRTRSVVTHAAFQCFGSEVTSRPCRRLFGVATGARTAGTSAPNSGPGLLELGRFSVSARSPRPPAAWWSGWSSSALCWAGRAGRRCAPGPEARLAVLTGRDRRNGLIVEP